MTSSLCEKGTRSILAMPDHKHLVQVAHAGRTEPIAVGACSFLFEASHIFTTIPPGLSANRSTVISNQLYTMLTEHFAHETGLVSAPGRP